jgi:hypothetical protein
MRDVREGSKAYGISVLLFLYIMIFLYKKVVWMS